jgi:hypothetical protein
MFSVCFSTKNCPGFAVCRDVDVLGTNIVSFRPILYQYFLNCILLFI